MEESSGLSFETSNAENDTVITAANVMEKLEEAWMNEKFSPDLLEHKAELVDCMLEQLAEMENNLRKLKKGDFRISVHRLEMERIQYMISDYLKIRLQKLEKHSADILEIEKNIVLGGEPSRLSSEEMRFLKAYVKALSNHLEVTALKHMPANMQSFDIAATVPKFNLNSYVFFKVKEPNHSIIAKAAFSDRNEVIDLEVESQHLLPYKNISHLLKDSAITLI